MHHVGKVFSQPGRPDFRALDDVSIRIRPNEFFTLLGPSGCGKTTLLRMIAGFEHPSEGEIRLDGADISVKAPYERPVNTVFQSYALFPHLTVEDNISFGLEMLRRPKASIDETVTRMLALVRMTEMRNRKIQQISGGQQQRVALARALAPHPKLLLLDEPLSALDLKLRKEMQIELKRLQHETGITFIFVTHDQEEALTMSDRIAVMSAGRVQQIGSPRDIYDRPANRFAASFIGETNFVTVKLLTVSATSGELELPGGTVIHAGVPDGVKFSPGKATIVVRPEHAELVGAGAGNLAGTVTNIVYFGTDTHYHLRLKDESSFIVRRQNRHGLSFGPAIGDEVGVLIGEGVAQLVED
nr:ABC transporter ATP-binding protein [Oryzibacter oryziterrae]